MSIFRLCWLLVFLAHEVFCQRNQCGVSNSGCVKIPVTDIHAVAPNCDQDVQRCSNIPCSYRPGYCCTPSAYQRVIATCDALAITYAKVAECDCQPCDKGMIAISGRIMGATCLDDNTCDFSIQVGGNQVTRTNDAGFYTFQTKTPQNNRVAFTVVDDLQRLYFIRIMVVTVTQSIRIYYNQDVMLTLKPNPVTFNATDGGTVPLGDDSEVKITFTPNSITRPDGTPYNGQVSASFDFINPSTPSDILRIEGELTVPIPGQSTPGILSSYGMLQGDLSADDGTRLHAAGVSFGFTPPAQYQLTSQQMALIQFWSFNIDTGEWELVSDMEINSDRRRKKRQTSNTTLTAQVDITSASVIYNLDALLSRYCFMKVRTFLGIGGSSFIESNHAILTSLYKRAGGTWANFLNSYPFGNGYCVPVPCDRNGTTDIEKVIVTASGYIASGPQVPSSILTDVNYAAAGNSFEITIPVAGLDLDNGGPFYSTYPNYQCYPANVTQNFFRFINNDTNGTGCNPRPLTNLIPIFQDCLVNVGICPQIECLVNGSLCCSATRFKLNRTFSRCTGSNITYYMVEECGCVDCNVTEIAVSGTIIADCAIGNSPNCSFTLRSNGALLTTSDAMGNFNFITRLADDGQFAFRVSDEDTMQYPTLVQDVPIVDGVQVYLGVNVFMNPQPELAESI